MSGMKYVSTFFGAGGRGVFPKGTVFNPRPLNRAFSEVAPSPSQGFFSLAAFLMQVSEKKFRRMRVEHLSRDGERTEGRERTNERRTPPNLNPLDSG